MNDDNNVQEKQLENNNDIKPTVDKPQNYVLALLVLVAVLAVGGYLIYGKSTPPEAPVNNEVPVLNKEESDQVDKLATTEICGQNVVLPSFVEASDLQQTNREEPYPRWWTCQSKTTDFNFSITVLDKEDALLSETLADNFIAFDNFMKGSESEITPEVNEIAITDTISTGIREVSLVGVLGENSLGYTGQIFQDISGAGIYQTATMVDERYIVYATYTIMDIQEGSDWRNYFDERWSFEKKNETELFQEYLKQELQKPATLEKIREINQVTKNI